ncbi:MAG: carboxyltransferase domain-containing protein [Thermoleophilaceae bacterium]
MIYDEPKLKPLGDCFLGIEFGDEADLLLNFRVLALQQRIAESRIPGVIELLPSFRQLAAVIDRSVTSQDRVRAAIEEMLPDVAEVTELPSRRLRLPCWYDDPWSAAIAERYGVPNNIEFVAEQNGLSVPELVERHTSTEFWIVCVGFTPGAPFTYPLDPSKQLVAPKYETPRDFTPGRSLSLAGFSTGTYPVPSPGGYQLLGRLAVEIYEPEPRNRAFPPNGVLLRAGDRLQFRSIDALEYDEIRDAAQAGEYDYDIAEDAFDVSAYLRSEEYLASHRGRPEPAA